MQKGMRLNDGHVAHLGLLAKKDGARRGYLSKRSADNTKWHTKWFALLQNMLFYFETDSSSRPSGLYLLEGCVCDRAPSPKPPLSAKDSLEKQVGNRGPAEGRGMARGWGVQAPRPRAAPGGEGGEDEDEDEDEAGPCGGTGGLPGPEQRVGSLRGCRALPGAPPLALAFN